MAAHHSAESIVASKGMTLAVRVYKRERAREGVGGRVVNSDTHMICIHAHHQCAFIRKSVRMRVRERASLSEIKGGKDAEGGRDLGLERLEEKGRASAE